MNAKEFSVNWLKRWDLLKPGCAGLRSVILKSVLLCCLFPAVPAAAGALRGRSHTRARQLLLADPVSFMAGLSILSRGSNVETLLLPNLQNPNKSEQFDRVRQVISVLILPKENLSSGLSQLLLHATSFHCYIYESAYFSRAKSLRAEVTWRIDGGRCELFGMEPCCVCLKVTRFGVHLGWGQRETAMKPLKVKLKGFALLWFSKINSPLITAFLHNLRPSSNLLQSSSSISLLTAVSAKFRAFADLGWNSHERFAQENKWWSFAPRTQCRTII